jgi:AcrR family transcriptional regulator
MENVAERAGVSRATIYRYYTNIDSISMDLILQLDVPKPDRFLAMTRKHQKMVPF